MAIGKPEVSPSRIIDTATSILRDADSLANIQRGYHPQPQFYGNQQNTGNHANFTGGLNLISLFSGFASALREQTVAERDPSQEFRLTKSEFDAVVSRAAQIGAYGNVPTDIIEDFLFMLVAVDKIETLQKISVAVEIDQLNNPQLIRNPSAILAVPGLEKIAFMASALSALLKSFGKRPAASNGGISGLDDIGSIIGSLGSLLGGFGGGSFGDLIDTPSPTKALGNFMSELITGKRIPMSVIAKNPNLQSPSFIGKTMFGEAPIALSNVDIDQLFNKRIGAFPKASSGGATTTFGITNFNTFAQSMNVDQFVGMVAFGQKDIPNTSNKYDAKQRILSSVMDITGANSTESVQTNRPDDVIPMMLGLSAGMSGLEKAPFSIDTFKQSWVTSMSASNFLQHNNPSMMEAMRKLV